MSDTEKKRALPPLTALATALVLFLAACGDAKEETVAACPAAAAKTAALKPLASGEIAAFAISDVPTPLPVFEFTDRDGKPTSTADMKGKTVLLNLWATWCAPCRHEMPALDKLQAELGGEKFQVLPVSIDRGGPQKPLGFYDEIGIAALPFYQDGTMGIFNGLKKEGYAFGLPATLLLDEEGCVLGNLNGPADWASDEARAMVKAAIGG